MLEWHHNHEVLDTELIIGLDSSKEIKCTYNPLSQSYKVWVNGTIYMISSSFGMASGVYNRLYMEPSTNSKSLIIPVYKK